MIEVMNESVPERFEACHMLRPLGYYLIVLWIFGTVLNGAILCVLIRNRKLRSSSTNILIAGLIAADFIGAFFEIPLPAFSLIYCRWIFAYAGCVFEAIISYFAGCSNMYMLCLISIDRYMVVTKYAPSKMMTIRRTYVSIGCAYALALFWTAMPLIGWSSYDYEGIGVSCSIKWEERSPNVISYNVTILTFVYLVPIMIIAITNVKVYQMIRQRCRDSIVNRNERRSRRIYLMERRLVHTMSFIIGGFLLAWTPYAIVVFIRILINTSHFPPMMSTLPALFAKSSVVWNPLIYVLRNQNFRYRRPLRNQTQ